MPLGVLLRCWLRRSCNGAGPVRGAWRTKQQSCSSVLGPTHICLRHCLQDSSHLSHSGNVGSWVPLQVDLVAALSLAQKGLEEMYCGEVQFRKERLRLAR